MTAGYLCGDVAVDLELNEQQRIRARQVAATAASTKERIKDEILIREMIGKELNRIQPPVEDSLWLTYGIRDSMKFRIGKTTAKSDGAVCNSRTNTIMPIEMKFQDYKGKKGEDGGDVWKRFMSYFSPTLLARIRKECRLPEHVFPVAYIFMGSLGDIKNRIGRAVYDYIGDTIPQEQILWSPSVGLPEEKALVKWLHEGILPIINTKYDV